MYRLEGYNLGSLEAFGAFFDGEFHSLAFFEGMISFTVDSGMMDKHVRTIFAGKKTITLSIVEPFDRTGDSFRHFIIPWYFD